MNMADINKTCRACLATADSFKYFLYINVSPDVFRFCTSIEIEKEEELPKALCNLCYRLLHKYTEFKRTCIQSQNALLSKIGLKTRHKKEIEQHNEHSIMCDKFNGNLVDDFSQINSKQNIQNIINIGSENNSNEVIIKEEELSEHFENDFDTTIVIDKPLEFPEENSDERIKEKKITKGRKKYTCKLCKKVYTYKVSYRAHKLRHQNKVTHTCTVCKKLFATRNSLLHHHKKWHSGVRLPNMYCQTGHHKTLHRERKRFMCNVCGKAFTTNGALTVHLDTHNENRERECTCEHCGRKFFNKKNLSSHIRRCHSGKRYICQVCNYPFTDKYNLSRHILLNHERNKDVLFKCELCDKSYATKSSYSEHQRVHSGERPFDCNYCSKSFISKRRLIDHHRTHTGEKPYKCQYCGHSFTQRGTLNRHMKVHSRNANNSITVVPKVSISKMVYMDPQESIMISEGSKKAEK